MLYKKAKPGRRRSPGRPESPHGRLQGKVFKERAEWMKASASEMEAVEKKIEQRMQETYDFVLKSPDPAPEQAVEGLYAEARV
jgi:hypothetical protein